MGIVATAYLSRMISSSFAPGSAPHGIEVKLAAGQRYTLWTAGGSASSIGFQIRLRRSSGADEPSRSRVISRRQSSASLSIFVAKPRSIRFAGFSGRIRKAT